MVPTLLLGLILPLSLLLLVPHALLPANLRPPLSDYHIASELNSFNAPRWPGATAGWSGLLTQLESHLLMTDSIAVQHGNRLELIRVNGSGVRSDLGDGRLAEWRGLGGLIVTLGVDGELESASVCLVAHLDSHAHTNGTSDNLVGVVQHLVVLRVLSTSRSLRVPVTVLFTDSEEQGLHTVSALLRHPRVQRCQLFVVSEAMGCAQTLPLVTSARGSSSVLSLFSSFSPLSALSFSSLAPFLPSFSRTFVGSNLLMDVTRQTRGSSTTESVVITDPREGACSLSREFCTPSGIPLLELVYADQPYKYHTVYDNEECLREVGLNARSQLLLDGLWRLQRAAVPTLLRQQFGVESLLSLGGRALVLPPGLLGLVALLDAALVLLSARSSRWQSLSWISSALSVLVCLACLAASLGLLFVLYWIPNQLDPWLSQRSPPGLYLHLQLLPSVVVFSLLGSMLLRLDSVSWLKGAVLSNSLLLTQFLFALSGSALFLAHFHVCGFFLMSSLLLGLYHLLSASRLAENGVFPAVIVLLIALMPFVQTDEFLSVLNPLSVQYGRDRSSLGLAVGVFLGFSLHYPFMLALSDFTKRRSFSSTPLPGYCLLAYVVLLAVSRSYPILSPEHPLGVSVSVQEVHELSANTIHRGIFITASNPVNNVLLERRLQSIDEYKYELVPRCFLTADRSPCFQLTHAHHSNRIRSTPLIGVPEVEVSRLPDGNGTVVTVFMANPFFDKDGCLVSTFSLSSDAPFSYSFGSDQQVSAAGRRSIIANSIWCSRYYESSFRLSGAAGTKVSYEVMAVLRSHTSITRSVIGRLAPDLVEFGKGVQRGPQLTGILDIIEL